MSTKSFHFAIIFLLGLFFFTIGLSSQEIIAFEARFYLFALEMWRHGASWFPTTYQHPYPDYPGTSTALIYLFSKLLGGLNKLTAVLPSAIASALTLSMTYLIGAKENPRYGWSAVFFLLMTLTFVAEARTISLDQYVTLITVCCFYFVCMKHKTFLLFPLLILGFAFRGPIGIIIPAGVLCVCYLVDQEYKRFIIAGLIAAVSLVLCSFILLGLAYHVGDVSFVQDVLRMEVGSRLHDLKMPPFSFYFTESFGGYALTYPLAILIIMGCVKSLFTSRLTDVKLLRKCLVWVLIILIGMSIPADKKMRYVLPMAPALALICAYLFGGMQLNSYLRLMRAMVKDFCVIFPVIAVLALGYLYYTQRVTFLNYPAIISFFIVLQVLNILVRKQDILLLALAAMTFVMSNILMVETINLNANRTREFVLNVEQQRGPFHTPLVFFQEGTDGLPIKYLVNMPHEEVPLYLFQSDELSNLRKNTFVIVGKENMPHISHEIMKHFQIILIDKIGHDDVIVLRKVM